MKTKQKAIINGVVLCLKNSNVNRQNSKKKCQAQSHVPANCDNAQRCQRMGGHHQIKDCSPNEPCSANRTEKHKVVYIGCEKYKEAELQARSALYAEALKYQPENTDQEEAQKIASAAQKKSRKISKVY